MCVTIEIMKSLLSGVAPGTRRAIVDSFIIAVDVAATQNFTRIADVIPSLHSFVIKRVILQGNILEDESAIEILSSSKVLSEEIKVKQEIASKTEQEIDDVRSGYTPVSLMLYNIFTNVY